MFARRPALNILPRLRGAMRMRLLVALSVAMAAILSSSIPALAVTVDDLYEVALPMGSSQEAAFAEALKTVVVRVSGQRDAPARLGSSLGNPRQYVQRFGVAADDILQVGFDDVSIERLLLESGLPIWGRERPATLVVLSASDMGGGWMSAESSALSKARLEKAARERGLPLRWATLDSQDQDLLSVANGSARSLMQVAQRHGANAVLVGRGTDASLRWTLATVDGANETTGSLEDGAHLTADTFARIFATSGSSLSQVNLEVAGIADLDAYATTLSYLESMTLVRSIALEQVSGDTLRFRLAVRGDAATLERAIGLENRLVPLAAGSESSTSANGRLAFRYRP